MTEQADKRITHFTGLGDECAKKGDHAAALDNYQRALEAARDNFGLHTPKLAPVLTKAIESSLQNRTQEADKRLERAAQFYCWLLAVKEHELGFRHQDLAPVLRSLAIVYDQLGRHHQAHELIHRLEAIQVQ